MSNIIEKLKNNKESFCLMGPELRRVAEKISKEHMLTLHPMGDWYLCHPTAPYSKAATYRLHKGYICTHPETERAKNDGGWATGEWECSWCEAVIEPKKPEYGWAEYPVAIDPRSFWAVQFPGGTQRLLCNAVGLVNFGGVKYKAPCECYGGGETEFSMGPAPEPCRKHGPWQPVKIQFWEVKK